MNDAHLHMLVNHFPLIGTIFGFGILFFGMILKKKPVKNTAFFLLIISAIFTALSMTTGEGAEGLAEKLPNITHEIIHEHEEIAEKFALIIYATGILAMISLYLNFKKNIFTLYTTFITLILAGGSIFLATITGISGGEIRHTEIRTESTNNIDAENYIQE